MKTLGDQLRESFCVRLEEKETVPLNPYPATLTTSFEDIGPAYVCSAQVKLGSKVRVTRPAFNSVVESQLKDILTETILSELFSEQRKIAEELIEEAYRHPQEEGVKRLLVLSQRLMYSTK